jgi:hypothetical protein
MSRGKNQQDAKVVNGVEPLSTASTVRASMAPLPDSAATRLYWFGVTRDCPMDQITMGGVTFCRETQPVRRTESKFGVGEWVRDRMIGDRADLTAEQVERIIAAARVRVVRTAGGGDSLKARVHLTHHAVPVDAKDENSETVVKPLARYRRSANDSAVVGYVYMVPVDDLSKSDLLNRDYTPEPISKTIPGLSS